MALSRPALFAGLLVFWLFGVSWASCAGWGLGEGAEAAVSIREGSPRGSSCASGRRSSYGSSYGSRRRSSYSSRRRSSFGGGGFSWGK